MRNFRLAAETGSEIEQKRGWAGLRNALRFAEIMSILAALESCSRASMARCLSVLRSDVFG
jgi:hypothetical protein